MSSQEETTASHGGYAKDRSALAGLGEALLDALDDHSSDTQWGQWLQAPYEGAATAGDVPLATALFKAGVAGDHLHPAIRADQGQLVKELLRLGASPTAKDRQGDAPIHVAASLGRGNIIKALLLKKDAVVHEDGRGRTPLHLACWKGHAAAVEVLLEMCSSREDVRRRLGKTRIGFKPFDLAVRGNHDGVKKALLARWPEEKASRTSLKLADGAILHMASEQNNVPMIEFLVVEAGTDVNFKDERGLAPLHSAALKGACQAMSALMKLGADANAAAEEGMTPLHYAAQGGHVAAIDVLCAAGVDVNLRVERYLGYNPYEEFHPEEDTWSALDFVAFAGNVDALKALVRHGADWKAVSSGGLTAFNTAAAGNKPEVIDALIELGAPVDGPPDAFKLALVGGHDVRPRPLDTALTINAPDAVRALLRHGADLYANGRLYDTFLEVAIERQSYSAIKAVLQHGVDPNLATPAGLTPLLLACSQGDGYVVDTLLRYGADMDVADKKGNSPLHLAAVSEGAWGPRAGTPEDDSDDGEKVFAGQHSLVTGNVWDLVGLKEEDQPGPSSVDVLLRAGADETAVNDENRTPHDRVRLELASDPRSQKTLKPVLELLSRAPQDRAWRRRALWVMCRAHPDKVRLALEVSRAKRARVDGSGTAAADGGGGEGGGGSEESGNAPHGTSADDIDRVAARVLGLQEEGIFRHVVGFL